MQLGPLRSLEALAPEPEPPFGGKSSMVSRRNALYAGLLLAAFSAPVLAEPTLLRHLEPLHPTKLSKGQLEKLLPGAKMSRKVYTGSTHYWTNEPNGKFVISTDNRGRVGTSTILSSSTAPGNWHISPDGRYCVTIEWKRVPTENWCRFVFETSEGYYASKSDHDGAEKVHRLVINGK
jgi:Protein of unknown function (DUF995)